jgi:hypothetical protein
MFLLPGNWCEACRSRYADTSDYVLRRRGHVDGRQRLWLLWSRTERRGAGTGRTRDRRRSGPPGRTKLARSRRRHNRNVLPRILCGPVEILDGTNAGKSTIADANGRFRFDDLVASPTFFVRLSKERHLTRTYSIIDFRHNLRENFQIEAE